MAHRRLILLGGLLACVHAPGATPTPTARLRVWVDADMAVGVHERDVDDGVALLAALRSPSLDVVGVSTVFGNAPLADADRIARELAAAWAPGLSVARGASGPGDVATPAVDAIIEALEAGPIDLLVLGPATNVGAALQRRPDLIGSVRRVVVVAGRRAGQRFTTGTTNSRGHRDFNFEQDPASMAALFEAGAPVVLAGFPVSQHVWVDAERLSQWENDPLAARFVPAARVWMGLWERVFSVAAFNPFDTLAVGVLVVPELLTCPAVQVQVIEGPDDVTEAAMQGDDVKTKPYLVASHDGDGWPARFCEDVDAPAFLAWLDSRLSPGPVQPDRSPHPAGDASAPAPTESP